MTQESAHIQVRWRDGSNLLVPELLERQSSYIHMSCRRGNLLCRIRTKFHGLVLRSSANSMVDSVINTYIAEYSLEENHYLRTVVYNGVWWYGGGIRKLESIHKNSKLLRVLSINGGISNRLPKKIGNLVHLTYLSLVLDKIEELPESIRNLRNLIYFVYPTIL
ncbi:hypothetical protein V2J09_013628 [Rumex salicifolius]